MSKCLEISKERIFNKIYVPLRRFYYRRWTKYTQTGKIALCCIAKMENEYIRYFVDYYKDLCFDKIFLYDNNDPDGERFDDVLGEHIQNHFVEIIDFRGEEVAQLRAYQDRSRERWRDLLNLDFFFRYNKKTKEKLSYVKKLEAEDAEVE